MATLMILSAACGSPETRAVDAKFRATVEGDGVPEGSVVSVDVYWLGNGSVDLKFDDVAGVIPGPDELKGVVLQDGNEVLTEGALASDEGAEPHHVRLEGSIDPDALDLKLSDTPPGGATVTVRLRGDARPFADAEALDGEYLVLAEYYPDWCPGDARPPLPGRNMPLDVLPTGDGARLSLDGRFGFTVPIASGSVDRTVTIDDRWYLSSFEAAVSGTLASDGVALTLDVPVPSSGPGCVDRLAVTGGKRLPDPAVIDGDYRAEYVWRDECSDEEGTFSAPLRLLDQGEGRYDFFDLEAWLQFDLVPGAPFEGDFIDFFGTGAIIAYDGVIDPPNLSYTAVYTYPYSDGPCDMTLEVTAYKRYFFPSETE